MTKSSKRPDTPFPQPHWTTEPVEGSVPIAFAASSGGETVRYYTTDPREAAAARRTWTEVYDLLARIGRRELAERDALRGASAAIYCSTATATGPDRQRALAEQEARCRALCDARGYRVVAVERDEGGGRSLDGRPGLAAIRRAMAEAAIRVLVVADVARISRGQRGIDAFGAEATAAGVRIDVLDLAHGRRPYVPAGPLPEEQGR